MDFLALGFAVTLFVLVTAPRERDPLDLLDE
jgi:hypothetical protein